MPRRRLIFSIPMLCRPKQSTRFTTKSGYVGTYTPKRGRDNAKSLASLLAQHRPETPFIGPVRFHVMFTYPWRKSETKANRAKGCLPKDTKPDPDNLYKQLADVMESCGFFVNDSQIADLRIQRQWSDAPGILIELEEMA